MDITICCYVCDRWHTIEYNHCGLHATVSGLLLNYNGGNIVLLSEEGIYHFKYKDIVFMKPAKMPPLDKFNKEFQDLLKVLQERED